MNDFYQTELDDFTKIGNPCIFKLQGRFCLIYNIECVCIFLCNCMKIFVFAFITCFLSDTCAYSSSSSELYKPTFLRSDGFILSHDGPHGFKAAHDPVKPSSVSVTGAGVQPWVGEGDSEGDLGWREDRALPGVLLQPGGTQGARPVLLEVEHAETWLRSEAVKRE